jgi:high-affinity Fe2+/Pb2+ permease
MFALIYTTDQLHREHAMTGRIFQALPTQTNTTVALIYKIYWQMMSLSIPKLVYLNNNIPLLPTLACVH